MPTLDDELSDDELASIFDSISITAQESPDNNRESMLSRGIASQIGQPKRLVILRRPSDEQLNKENSHFSGNRRKLEDSELPERQGKEKKRNTSTNNSATYPASFIKGGTVVDNAPKRFAQLAL